MTKSYTRKKWARRLQKFGIATVLVTGATAAAQAQLLNYSVATASNIPGTYTDLATVATSTVITTANTDDANSAPQNIGFSFSYNGSTFTQFVLNTNGIMRLGSAAPSVANLFAVYENGQTAPGVDPISSTSPANVNLIAPFNFDLEDGSAGTAEYRVATTGTAPNRVCTIQWRNVRDKAGTINATQFDNFEFQVKLYETTNVIDIVYGNTVSATAGAAINRFPTVGIKGSGSAAGQDVLVNKASSTAAWSTAIFITGVYAASTLNYRRLVGPDPGRTFRFATAPANDAAVTIVYTLGKIASPAALPHAVRAVVTNAGTAAQANIVATLNVTGANTFTNSQTIASLAAGASTTVTFANYPATLTPGTNAVTVTVPADGNNANNSATYGQEVTTGRISYIDPTTAPTLGVGLGNATFVSKYTLPAATVISDVALTFAAATAPAVNTAPYQVVIYDASGIGGLPGQLLYSSAVQNRTSAGGAATVAIPNVAVPASFFIGLKETSATNVAIAYQIENPIRPATFYFSTDGAVWNDLVNGTPKARFAIEFGTTVPNCAPPTAITVSNATSIGAIVSFTPPTSGTTSYEVLYGPTGFNTITGGTVITTTNSTVTLTGLSPATAYQVYVRSNCTAGGTSIYAAPVAFTTQCNTNPAVSTFPYTQNFDTILPGQVLPCGLATLDANGDGTTWAVSNTNANSGANSIRYRGLLLNNVAADDWFFTPPLTLLATSRYQVAFRYRGEGIANSPSSYTERLEVKSGTAATVAAQTNLLYTNAAITNTSYSLANGTSTPVVALLPAGAGTQYVGFHINSASNQGNLYIDDISVTAVVATANSEALLRAVSVFPNPSTTGLFDLEVHGVNAKGNLGVLVTNTLGQRVFAGSARDNYVNKLDLSALAPGIYYLQVRNGNEQMTSRINIVK